MTFKRSRKSAKQFFQNLLRGHKVNTVYQPMLKKQCYIDAYGNHTEAFWKALKQSLKECENPKTCSKYFTDVDELLRSLYAD